MLILISLYLSKTRIGELSSLPPHCGCFCHHVGLLFCRQGFIKRTRILFCRQGLNKNWILFCRQGLKRIRTHGILSSASDHVGLFFCCLCSKKYKSRVGDFEMLAGLGDSHLWWGPCQPFLCSAHHLCQGDIPMFNNECQLELQCEFNVFLQLVEHHRAAGMEEEATVAALTNNLRLCVRWKFSHRGEPHIKYLKLCSNFEESF